MVQENRLESQESGALSLDPSGLPLNPLLPSRRLSPLLPMMSPRLMMRVVCDPAKLISIASLKPAALVSPPGGLPETAERA